MTTQILSKFQTKLQNQGFVKTDKFVESFCLSLLTNIPILYYGKGGYGKTEMVLSLFDSIEGTQGMLECDPETTASHMKGGAIARTTKNGKTEVTEAFYKVEASLLKNDKFFLEEMMDSLFSAQSVLKAIITNRQININGEKVESINKVLVGATNHNPKTLLESLPEQDKNSYDALLQRFIIVEHGWETHTMSDYEALDNCVSTNLKDDFVLSLGNLEEHRKDVDKVKIENDVLVILRQLAQKSAENGYPVSPRAYKWTQKLMKAYAFIHGKNTAKTDSLLVLTYLSYWNLGDKSIGDMLKDISLLTEIAEQREILNDIEQSLSNLEDQFSHAKHNGNLDDTFGELVEIKKSLKLVRDDLYDLEIYDENDSFYQNLTSVQSRLVEKLQVFWSELI